ncbi:hypothetical protein GGE65_007165 [Skermanella aerolata]|uniref:hypothetical protein n=2 Tax=Pseudomonadota TaxID=1224 RepID=UPI003D253E07
MSLHLALRAVAFMLLLALAAVPSVARGDFFSILSRRVPEAIRPEAGGARSLDDLLTAARQAASGRRGVYVLAPQSGQLRLVGTDIGGQVINVETTAANLSGVVASYTVVDLLIPEESLDDLRHLLPSIPENTRPQLLRRDGSAIPIEAASEGVSGGLLARVGERVYLDLRSAPNLDVFAALARTRITRADVEVVSLFDPREIDTVRLLDQRVGDIHKALAPDAAPGWIANLRGSPDRLLLVVGHVENGSFVMRGVGGEVLAQVELEKIVAAARDAGSGVVLLGCDTAGAMRSGFLSPVNVTAVADGLAVLRSGGTLGELLEALAKASPEGLVVTQALLDDVTAMLLARARNDKRAASHQLMLNGVRFALTPRGAWAVPLLNALKWVGMFWFFGFVSGIFFLPSGWKSWNDTFPGTGNSYAHPITRAARRTLRFMLFFAMFPFLVLINMAHLLVVIGTSTLPLTLFVVEVAEGRFVMEISLLAIINLAAMIGGAALVRKGSWLSTLRLGWRDVLAFAGYGVGLPTIVVALLYTALSVSGLLIIDILALLVVLLAIWFMMGFLVWIRRHLGIRPYDLPWAAVLFAILIIRTPQASLVSADGRRILTTSFRRHWHDDRS